MNSSNTAADGANREGASRNLISISPFFIVKYLQTSIAYYRDRLGFQVEFRGPADDVSRQIFRRRQPGDAFRRLHRCEIETREYRMEKGYEPPVHGTSARR